MYYNPYQGLFVYGGTSRVLGPRAFGLSGFRAFGLSGFRALGLLGFRALGL